MKNLGYGLTQEHLKKTYAELTQNFRSMQYPQFWIRKLPITPADFPRNFAPQITRYNIRTSADPHIRILPPATGIGLRLTSNCHHSRNLACHFSWVRLHDATAKASKPNLYEPQHPNYHSHRTSTVRYLQHDIFKCKTTLVLDFLLLPGVTAILQCTICIISSNKPCYNMTTQYTC